MGFLDKLLGSPITDDPQMVAKRVARGIWITADTVAKQSVADLSSILDSHASGPQFKSRDAMIALELAYLYFCLVDRMVSQKLNNEQRSRFVNQVTSFLLDEVVALGPTMGEELKLASSEVRELVISHLQARFLQYGACKGEWAGENEPKSGTIFWEFGKNIAMVVRQEHNPFVINVLITVGMNGMAALLEYLRHRHSFHYNNAPGLRISCPVILHNPAPAFQLQHREIGSRVGRDRLESRKHVAILASSR